MITFNKTYDSIIRSTSFEGKKQRTKEKFPKLILLTFSLMKIKNFQNQYQNLKSYKLANRLVGVTIPTS
jgi:hypothetical protein